MKNIDLKSLLIGILITIIVFLTIGANSTKTNLGDIIVKSIIIMDENNNWVGFLGSTKNSSSALMLMNPLTKNQITISNDETEAGIRIFEENEDGVLSKSIHLGIYKYLDNNLALLFTDKEETNLIHIGVLDKKPQIIMNDINGYPSLYLDNGGISLFNNDGALVVSNGLQKNGDGTIVIMDSTGHNSKWIK